MTENVSDGLNLFEKRFKNPKAFNWLRIFHRQL